jgi:gas vesicle protein
MSRTQRSFLVAGAAVAAGATGWALGILFAPASGKELRKRITWKSKRQFKAFSHDAERFLNDVTERAATELARARSCCGVKAG